MIKYENECVGCEIAGQNCLGNFCPYKNTIHYYCDDCTEEETLYHFEDKQLCINCIIKRLKIVDVGD